MGQRVQNIVSDEIIDEKKILKEAEEREKEAKAEAEQKKDEEKAHKKQQKKVKSIEKKLIRKRPKHGKKYRNALKLFERNTKYEIKEAVEILKKQKIEAFDSTILLAVSIDKKLDNLRGSVNLPGGVVKKKKIEIVDEKNVEKIIENIKASKLDFDILIATPTVMPKLGQVAKILGPKGLMPNPKSGTVSNDPKETAKDFEAGKVEFKVDKGNNIHLAVAKASFDSDKIIQNIETVISAMPIGKIKNVFLSRAMGPSIKIQI